VVDRTPPSTPTSVGIVGLGLIGGSLARRLVSRGVNVTAWNHRDHPYAQATADGIRCVPDLRDLAQDRPDVLVLCNPRRAMPEVLAALAPAIDRQATTLTDVGSVKGMVRSQVEAAGLGECYVGAHPMAGNELSGGRAPGPARGRGRGCAGGSRTASACALSRRPAGLGMGVSIRSSRTSMKTPARASPAK